MKTDTNPACPNCGAEEILPGECPGGCDILPIIRVERGDDAATYWGALLAGMAPLARVRLADRLRELVAGGEL
jgi:hypothetical protein